MATHSRTPPERYLCPITGDLMEDPVLTMGGHCYDRASIARWFAQGKKTDPLTGAELSESTLIPNHQLRGDIIKFKETDVSELENQVNSGKMSTEKKERLEFLRKEIEQQEKDKKELERLEREQRHHQSDRNSTNSHSTNSYSTNSYSHTVTYSHNNGNIVKNIISDLNTIPDISNYINLSRNIPNINNTSSTSRIPDENGNINCKNCHNCYNCVDCKNCYNCQGCNSCKNCNNCQGCSSCKNCNNCQGCSSCKNCDNKIGSCNLTN